MKIEQELEQMGKHFTRLKDVLKEQGRSQAWLCERTEIHATWMNKIANGHVLPRVDDAMKIAALLGVSVEYLWGDDVK